MEKPKKLYQQLGPDVRVAVQRTDTDPWADKTLAEIGRTLCPDPALTYQGSVALHLYSSETNLLKITTDWISLTQKLLKDIPEQQAQLFLQELIKDVARHYGRKMRSTDKNYSIA